MKCFRVEKNEILLVGVHSPKRLGDKKKQGLIPCVNQDAWWWDARRCTVQQLLLKMPTISYIKG
jgi:hypothetical protein